MNPPKKLSRFVEQQKSKVMNLTLSPPIRSGCPISRKGTNLNLRACPPAAARQPTTSDSFEGDHLVNDTRIDFLTLLAVKMFREGSPSLLYVMKRVSRIIHSD